MSARSTTGRLAAAALLAAAAILAAGRGARGAGFGIYEQNAAATGSGATLTATADSPSAVFYNPAGLAMQEGLSLEAGVTLIVPIGSHEDPATGKVTGSETGVFYPPQLYLAYTAPQRFAVGIGFFVPFGLGIAWPEDWSGLEEVTSIELQTYVVNPALSWSPAPWVSLGLGVAVARATVELTRGIELVDARGTLHAGGAANGIGANAGLLLRFFGGRMSVGLNYRSAVNLRFTGNADFTVPDAFEGKLEDQPFTSKVRLPHVLALGVAGRPHPLLLLGFDVVVTAWSSFQSFGFAFPEDEHRAEEDRLSQDEPRLWHDAWALRFGIQLGPLPRWLLVRAGVAYDRAPSPSYTLSPTLPDSDRVEGSVGAGFLLPKGVRIDVAYMYIHFLERASTGEAFPAVYNASAHMVGLTLGWRMPK